MRLDQCLKIHANFHRYSRWVPSAIPDDTRGIVDAAFLAALPKAPNNYNPARFPEAARSRRDWVIDRMAEDRAITAAQMAAVRTKLPMTEIQLLRTNVSIA